MPVVLSASGIEPDWIETTGPHRVTPLVGVPTGMRLANAIGMAIQAGGPDDRTFVQG